MKKVLLQNHWMIYRALRTAVLITIAYFIVNTVHLPVGRWMVLTIAIVSNINFGASVKKAIERVMGTILGCAAGYILGVTVIHYHYWFVYTFPLWIFLAWYLVIFSYDWVMFFGMIMVTTILYVAAIPGTDIQQLLIARAVDIGIGVLVALCAEMILPVRKSEHDLIDHFAVIRAELVEYIDAVLSARNANEVEALKPKLMNLSDLQVQQMPLLTLTGYERISLIPKKPNQFDDEMKSYRLAAEYLSNISLLLSDDPTRFESRQQLDAALNEIKQKLLQSEYDFILSGQL